MNDLIDRARIAETVGFIAACSYGDPIDAKDVLKAIDEAPTIEAVEVVRCENCVHSREIKGTPKKWYFTDRVMHCAELRGSASDDGISAVWRNGYCDDGKRKEAADGRSD